MSTPANRLPASPKPKTAFLQDFSRGVNISTLRESIEDNEAWWMEGMIPLAPGNLSITNGPLQGDAGGWHTAIAGETGAPSYMFAFNMSSTDFIFAVWSNSGNGYIGKIDGSSVTKNFVGTLTSGKTSAAQWNNSGVLIVDPAGYWDFNITTAATLTSLNNSVQSITINDPGSGYAGAPAVTFGGPGTGAAATAYIGLGSVSINAPGTNYKVGDVVTVPFNFPGGGQDMTLNVTTVNATGGITGVSVNTVGKGISLLGGATGVLGGAGNGATMTVTGSVTEIRVTNRGHGYTSAPTVTLSAVGATRAATATANVSGSLAGTSIVTYAGRAWIASGRTVTFTDAGQYASFVGSGSSFTINDDYLHNNITALYAANNYLYIFGDTSIDALSNVTVTAAGTASFSRINLTASIGTSQPYSIFSYYRSIAFGNGDGFYLLSGATPEKISDKLDLLLNYMLNSSNDMFGGTVVLFGQLCAAFSVLFLDIVFGGGAQATMLVIYFKGRWFFCRQARNGTPLTFGAMVMIPVNGKQTLFTIDGAVTPQYYELFSDPFQTYFRLRTKLYPLGNGMASKQAIKAGAGVEMGGLVSSRAGISFSVDTETHQPGQSVTLPAGVFSGYNRFIGTNNEGAAQGAQFMGMSFDGTSATQADVTMIEWLALQQSEVGEWLA